MIIGFAGRKRSGKDSALKYVYGNLLMKNDVVDRFDMDEAGNLLIPGQYEDGIHMGVFDTTRRDEAFASFASRDIWPYVKDYYFASFLKEMILKMYDVSYEQLNGTTEQKNSLTKYTWRPFLKMLPEEIRPTDKNPDDHILAREFIQRYADLLREIDENCFIKPTISQILYEKPDNSLIGDIRFINEAKAIKEVGGKLILLKRKIDEDSHASEAQTDAMDEFADVIIDNTNMTLEDKNREIHRVLSSWGVF